MTVDPPENLVEPGIGKLSDEELASPDFAETVTEKALKVAKRHRARWRLEVLRLRKELGYYDLDFEDDF